MKRNSRSQFALGVILAFVLIAAAIVVAPYGVQARPLAAPPVFTGDAAVDFAIPGTVSFNDSSSDVGVPSSAPGGTVSGWNFTKLYFYYDVASDTMYVGVDCIMICGDADGDGNPGGTSSWLNTEGGADQPDLSNSESFTLLLDGNNDYVNFTNATGKFETAVGVSSSKGPSGDIFTDWGVYDFTTGLPGLPSLGYGALIPGHASSAASPSAGAPDLEFTIANFHTLPGFSFTPGEVFHFQMSLFAGSLEDDGIGEDYLPAQTSSVNVTIGKVDFTAVKTNDVGGSVNIGNSFNWSVAVSNAASMDTVTFDSGNVIFKDNLPAGPTYPATATVTPSGLTGTGSVACAIASNIMTCTASGGTVKFPAGASFTAVFNVAPNATGSLVNPPSGVCKADPNNLFTETDETNNSCTNTVTVNKGTPTISTTPGAGGLIGLTVLTDTATLSGGYSPTGSVTFNLYPPSDATCSGAASYTETDVTSPYGTSTGFTSNAAGTWHWKATYNGDANNNAVTSLCADEPVTVVKASPGISTTPGAGGTVGVTLTDTASLSGGYSPTGSVTFDLYPPSDATCSGAATYTFTDNTSPYAAPGFASNAVGTWHWKATYNGDGNNNSNTSLCADEPVTVTQATPTIGTTLSAASIAVGGSAHDASALTGATATAGGTVTYTAYTNNTCTTGAMDAGTKTVTNGVVPNSDNLTFNTAGTYYWQAVYSGDANNQGASSLCTSEVLTVKAAPTIGTTLSAASIAVGASAHDSSALTGATATAGGTVTYTSYTNNTCTTGAQSAGAKTVTNGVVPDSDSLTFNTAGTYYWQAVYSGDAGNLGATSVCTSEVLTVNKNSPTIGTTLSAASIAVGASAHDSSALTGATATAGGTVTYTSYTDNACTTGAQSAGTKTVTNGLVPDSNNLTFNTAGTYYWRAVYSGDANNNGASSLCTSEVLTVNQATPTIGTTLHDASIKAGASTYDTATLTGATSSAGGTVTYRVYSDGACSTQVGSDIQKTVTNGSVPNSDAVTFDHVGMYYWRAFYGGDTNNAAASSACGAELLTVTQATPSITTLLSSNPVARSQMLYDTAQLTGSTGTAGGTVSYAFYTDDHCGTLGGAIGTKPVSNGIVPDSDNVAIGSSGTYYFIATYSGDADNQAADSGCANEPLTVNKTPTTISTTLSSSSIGIGGTAHDSAVVSLTAGSFYGQGTVTYKYYTDNACSAGEQTVGTVTVNYDGLLPSTVPDSPDATFNTDGTYYWQATYSGDADYLGSQSVCTSEQLTVQSAALGDFVWNDLNANGVQDAGEPGINGVTVDLYTGAGAFVTTTITAGGGLYHFTNLAPGDYYVEFTLAAGYDQFSPANQGADDAKDSDGETVVSPTIMRTITTTLSAGEDDLTWDQGMYKYAAVGDFVWEDLNANGVQDDGATGINGLTVKLYDAITNLQVGADATTAGGGFYHFTGLTPGQYYVVFDSTGYDGFSPTGQGTAATDSNANPATGHTATITLTSGQTDNTWDAGLYKYASLGDFVWNDINRNGVQNVGETGIGSVQVDLHKVGTPGVFATQATTGIGAYQFNNLVPGTYYVVFTRPAAYSNFTTQNNEGAPSSDALDSDADTTTGQTGNYTLASGDSNMTVDAGMYQTAALGDFVWNDLNANGLQDDGATGINGVTVDLYTSTGTFVATTTTAGGGLYLFNNLVPGDYYVEFTLAAGYSAFSPANVGANDAIDSDAETDLGSGVMRTATTTLTSGENDLTWDAGMYKLASIGDFVWDDLNANGLQDDGPTGISGVTVNLFTGAGASAGSTTTDGSGYYSFADLVPGDYYVEFTLASGYDAFSPANAGGNDAIDSDAQTIVSPTVMRTATTTLASGENDLTWDAGMYQLASLGDYVWNDVNANGLQDDGATGIVGATVNLFTGTGVPAGSTITGAGGAYSFTNLVPGSYYVEFTLAGGYGAFSPANVGGDDAVDSDAQTVVSATVKRTATTTLTSGENDLTWDAGMYVSAGLGDFVWDDLNANGLQDDGATGISGVTVDLYTGAGTFVATTSTDGSGYYSFTNLVPGDYYLTFTLASGYDAFSPANVGGDDTIDSDADTTTGQTATTTLSSGENDLTWDAGMYAYASIGDLVWDDLNSNGEQDDGATGIDGVTVELYDCAGHLLDTTSTSGGGLYAFTGLTPGDYNVQFSLVTGYSAFSPQNVGSNLTDSDADIENGATACTTLTSGETDNSWDAGLIADAPLIGVAKSASAVKVTGMAGTWDVTFSILVKNYGNVPLTALQVTDNLVATFLTVDSSTTFSVQSLSSADFTVNPAYDGDGDDNLLTGVDTLPVDGEGTITLVVRVVPDQGSYLNTATASGLPPSGPRVTDDSQDGVNPDPTPVGNPQDDNEPTPITFGVTIFDPPYGVKMLDANNLPVLHWTMVWINNTNIVGVSAEVSDSIPVGTTYVDPSIVCTPASALTTTDTCEYVAPGVDPAYPLGRIHWIGVIGPDLGATDADSAVNELYITFDVTVNNGVTSVQNEATIDSDLTGDHDTDDAGEQRVAEASASWNAPVPPAAPKALPNTGFAPNRVTVLPPQSVSYSDLGDLWLEIPALGVKMPIVGVPQTDGAWDVSWLGNDAGWLNGTAYPTHAGNSVLTGHVYDAYGKPGPFVGLNRLWWGSQIIVHAGGAQYVYEVRSVSQVRPELLSSVLKHENLPWITLITCRGYDEASNSYKYRVVVRAVLVEVK